MTAQVLGNVESADFSHAWSLAVFFESYMTAGSGGTGEAFGPKDPVELKPVSSGG